MTDLCGARDNCRSGSRDGADMAVAAIFFDAVHFLYQISGCHYAATILKKDREVPHIPTTTHCQ